MSALSSIQLGSHLNPADYLDNGYVPPNVSSRLPLSWDAEYVIIKENVLQIFKDLIAPGIIITSTLPLFSVHLKGLLHLI